MGYGIRPNREILQGAVEGPQGSPALCRHPRDAPYREELELSAVVCE